MPGICTSISTKSKGWPAARAARQASTAASPSPATVGRWPSRVSSARASSALISLSSATRIESGFAGAVFAAVGVRLGRQRRREFEAVVAEAGGERDRAHRLDQIAGEAGRLQRRQLVAVARRDQHDAARHVARVVGRKPPRRAQRRPAARRKVRGEPGQGGALIVHDGDVWRPSRRAGAPAGSLRPRTARRSASTCCRDRAPRRHVRCRRRLPAAAR